ncbi:N-acetylgalactosamine kinase [Contarinia nasturtii]|uniref:N-acetylgalactosamine kinase n=1 Tax=Contarinia nasturtii TaxID=265458 RepID=UPI0012D3D39A|nr:N-acetylgalactosamine kinase [Contarinia nasturtii]XP_031618441.1 N-acetylgalactosamine kinase [Contarinia nasturtii]XP_031618442.1 N-acetylgalactosamine kinase [Contarinia nasturtii]
MTDTSNDISVGSLTELQNINNVQRTNKLCDAFQKTFNCEPKFFVNVPGRVNLIGEHIDYCGYPVLPMAIEQSILLAVAPSEDRYLHITNTNERYKPLKCPIDNIIVQVPENGTPPEWYNYFLCGVKGIYDELPNGPQWGMLVTVSGNIPPAAGLSSSSALVSAATLCTSFVNKFSLNKTTLADISAKCERYIGTQGGGMDQAIAFLAIEGCAQYIEWEPLTATSTALPSNAFFVIANSLTKANKAATSDFNQRVIECRLACRILAKSANLPWRELERFSTLQKRLQCSLTDFERFADRILTRDLYSRDDIINFLEVDENEFENQLLTPNTKHLEKFKLRQRAMHVIQESIRVTRFREVATKSNNIEELGKLMRESHLSLNELYECSHENLNRLVDISDRFNISARLTGAGWGGCIVAICDSLETSSKYIAELKEKYFKNLPDYDENEADNIVFVTNPQRGATIYLNAQ